ncbi:winged helix-turn-helix domain-containing protein [Microbispora bryophytorum]|uniref:winged helix-turn-helix domain-containing protein n=1 Tax=Microbispora bryophytorum TaxID=1460882 RepID=UPI00341136F4
MAVTNDPEEPIPAYRRLAAMLREEIVHGRIEPDRPLPSEERLTREHGFAPEDVRRAVEMLGGEGLVYTVEGRGAYVSTRAEETGGG